MESMKADSQSRIRHATGKSEGEGSLGSAVEGVACTLALARGTKEAHLSQHVCGSAVTIERNAIRDL